MEPLARAKPCVSHQPSCVYLQKLGIDIPECMVCQPDHGEQAFNVMDELVRSGAVELIVVDSVSALVPRHEVEGDIGTPQVSGSTCRASLQCLG
jgi:recombination protein RecA